MSSNDIEHASFDEVENGGWDAAQVKVFLLDVAKQVRNLEHRVAEANEMRAAALELVQQAETLVDQVKDRSEVDLSVTTEEAKRVLADAEDRAREIETAAADRVHAAEEEVAAVLARSKSQGSSIVREAERNAAQLIADAEARAHQLETRAADKATEAEAEAAERAHAAELEVAQVLERSRKEAAALVREAQDNAARLIEETQTELGWRQIEAAANAEHEREAVRHDAAKMRELARVDAAAIVAGALEEADRVTQRVFRNVAAVPGRAEVERIVAEAEALLENARAESESIIARANASVGLPDDSKELGDEVRRSVSALRTVTDARTREAEAGPIRQVRGRAVQMLAELRRSDGRLDPAMRSELADELHELRDLMAKLEGELLADGHDAGAVRVTLDLTDTNGASADDDDDDSPAMAVRPSRYQQRSANLPHIGDSVDSVNKAMQSMRDQLKALE